MILLIIVLVITFYLFYTFLSSEKLTLIYDNTEFRGINLLGTTSQDGVFHTNSIEECNNICDQDNKCVGFSYFKPNGDCYIFGSGNVIPNDQGFAAGKKYSS